MSAAAVLQAALVETLAAALPVSVFDAPPPRAGEPYLVVDEPQLADWSTKTWRGREGRVSVQLFAREPRPMRLRRLAGAVEDALEGWRPTLAEGWQLAGLTLARSRLMRAADDGWRGTSEWAVRLYRLDG